MSTQPPIVPGDRAEVGVEAEHPLDLGPLVVINAVGTQLVGDVDPLDNQDLAVQFDLADRVCLKTTVSRGDTLGLKGTPEGASQSPGGSGHQVVEGGGVGLLLVRLDAVVLGDRVVHAEHHRLLQGRQRRGPQRPPLPRDAHL